MTTAEIDRVTTPETETTKTTKETNLKPAAAEDGKEAEIEKEVSITIDMDTNMKSIPQETEKETEITNENNTEPVKTTL